MTIRARWSRASLRRRQMEQIVHDVMQWAAGLVVVWRGVGVLQSVIESRVRTEERIATLIAEVERLRSMAHTHKDG